MKAFNVARAADRVAMAVIIADLARSYGCTAEIEPEEKPFYPRSRRVNIAHPGGARVTVELDGERVIGDSFLLSWYMATGTDTRYSPSFGFINECHKRKATHLAPHFDAMIEIVLKRDLEMLQSGEAYASVELTNPR